MTILPKAFDALKNKPVWACWVYMDKGGGKRRKMPINPHTGKAAKSNDPATWGTLAEAQELAERRGIGIGVKLGDGLCGVDLDHVRDPETGALKDYARGLIAELGTYTEVSPSGTGVHMLMLADSKTPELQRSYRQDERTGRDAIEIYTKTQFLTVTGNALPGCADVIRDDAAGTETLRGVVRRYFPERVQGTAGADRRDDTAERRQIAAPPAGLPPERTDAEVLEAMFRKKPRLSALYHGGDCSYYKGDHSSAALALAEELAYWTDGRLDQADRLYRASAMMHGASASGEPYARKYERDIRGFNKGRQTRPDKLANMCAKAAADAAARYARYEEERRAERLQEAFREFTVCDDPDEEHESEPADAPGQRAEAGEDAPPTPTVNTKKQERAQASGDLPFDRKQFEAEEKAAGRVLATPAQTKYLEKQFAEGEKRLPGLSFSEDCARFKKGEKYRTGFWNLDDKQAFYPGLYALGAGTSLGKTTFVLQLADAAAVAGREVLFFSLEQSPLELVSKSLARKMYEYALEEQEEMRPKHVKTVEPLPQTPSSLSIRCGRDWDFDYIRFRDAYAKREGLHMRVIYTGFNSTYKDVVITSQDFIKRAEAAGVSDPPLIIVDYLQALAPVDPRRPTMDNIDSAVRAFKDLQVSTGATVVVTSSLNRVNYLAPVSFESFKGSGGIEFTADFVAGLDLYCLYDRFFDQEKQTIARRAIVNTAKSEVPREIVYSVLKNRFGEPTYKCEFRFHANRDYFEAVDGFADDCSHGWRAKVLEFRDKANEKLTGIQTPGAARRAQDRAELDAINAARQSKRDKWEPEY